MTAAELHRTLALHECLYGRSVSERIQELIEATDALAGALQTLRCDPTPDAAERLCWQLAGMGRAAGSLTDALVREVRHAD